MISVLAETLKEVTLEWVTSLLICRKQFMGIESRGIHAAMSSSDEEGGRGGERSMHVLQEHQRRTGLKLLPFLSERLAVW
jgi:hypothetical protein